MLIPLFLTHRHKVLDPYLLAFDPEHVASSDEELPPHRYLFHCYVYQYHLLQFTTLLVSAVRVSLIGFSHTEVPVKSHGGIYDTTS